MRNHNHFNPRPPCGGRPGERRQQRAVSNFNPRPPCGGRPYALNATGITTIQFQSTPPVRGATFSRSCGIVRRRNFNPRPPCGGRPRGCPSGRERPHYFNPRPPCGGRLRREAVFRPSPYFNPRPPCGGRLLKFESLFGFSNNSCMVIRFLAAPSSLL